MTTRSAFSASLRIAFRTFGASRRIASPVPRRCCLMKAARARSAWARTVERDPRRDEVEDCHLRAVAPREGIGEPDRELGMGTAADRHEDALDLGRAALLDDGDVARGVAHDLVDGGREDGRARTIAAAGALPPQPKMTRSASCSPEASMIPSAARRPIRTIGWIVVPRARNRALAGATGVHAGPVSRPLTVACPRAPPRSRGRSAPRHACRGWRPPAGSAPRR